MKAMIFAAGLGTRLKPLTDTMPKALVPVCGKPLLRCVMEKLKDAGFDDFVINVHHFADMIEEYVRENDSFGCRVAISDERDLLRDTGGGILHAKELLSGGCHDTLLSHEDIRARAACADSGAQVHGCMEDFFLVHNVDIISDLDIRWFCSQARQGALAVLLVSERETSRYLLFDDDMRLAGWTNVRTGEVKSPYRDLDVSKCRKYAFAGIHLVSNRIFDIMTDGSVQPLGNPGRSSALPPCPVPGTDVLGTMRLQGQVHRPSPFGECFSIIDFYLSAAASCPIYGVLAPHLTITDVGKPESLAGLNV